MSNPTRELLHEIRQRVLQAGKAYNARTTKASDMAASVPAAVKARDSAALKQAWADIKLATGYLEQKVLPLTKEGQDLLAKATLTPDWEAQQKSFDGLSESLHAWYKAAHGDILTYQKLQLAIGKCLKAVKAAQEEAQRKLGDLEVLIDADSAKAASIKADMKTLYDEGWKLFAKRDFDALDAQKKKAQGLPLRACADALKAIDTDMAAFKAAYIGKKALPASAEKKMADAIKALQARRDQMELDLMAGESSKASLAQLNLHPVDLDKAVAHLDLDRAAKAELGKALTGDDNEVMKKLEALGRKLKHKLGGREMFARLRKAQFV